MIKVLIVDDEYIMRQGLKYMIDWEQEGFEIVGEATNGAEALQFIETLTPQIIICDIVMPQLDGVDFSEAVHRMYPRIQTIILSGYDKYEYVRHTLINTESGGTAQGLAESGGPDPRGQNGQYFRGGTLRTPGGTLSAGT